MQSNRTVSQRFWEKVEKSDGCWVWKAGTNGVGYGRFWIGSKREGTDRWVYPHRWLYEQEKGPVPLGLELDHLCRIRNCVRPDHLEPVTRRQNILRGILPDVTRARIRKASDEATHCRKGHELSDDNIYRWRHYKFCRRCRGQMPGG